MAFDPQKHAKMQKQVSDLLRKLKSSAETIPRWKTDWRKASDLNDANVTEMAKGREKDKEQASVLLSWALQILAALEKVMFKI